MKEFFGATVLDSSAQQKSPLDIVMYLASLASSPRAIYELMNPTRNVTAWLQSGQPLSLTDIQKLAMVYTSLETYLTHDEPLRAYTPESIQKKVLTKFKIGTNSLADYWTQATQSVGPTIQTQPISEAAVDRAHRLHRFGRLIIAWSLVLGVAGLFLPAQPCDPLRFCNNFDMAFSIGSDLLLIGGAGLFLIGLGGFKTRFKTAYRLLCAAMILFALAQSQQAIYTQFGLWGSPFVSHGGTVVGFVPGVALFYVSMYLFARLLKVKTFVTSVWAMLATAVTLIVVCLSIPHFPSVLPPEVLRVGLPPVLFLDTLLVYAALIVLAIKKVAAPVYTPALAWLFLGLAVVAVSLITYTVIQVFFASNTDNAFLSYGGVSALLVMAGILLVRSGVVFNQITED